jgi:hypothetical protein
MIGFFVDGVIADRITNLHIQYSHFAIAGITGFTSLNAHPFDL